MSKFFTVNRLANSKAEILLYGYIGDEVIAGDFVRELNYLSQTNNTINVRINSAGGSIFEGLAIYNAIKNCSVPVDGYIDGVAASMGSVIAVGCRKVYMSKASMFMSHRANGFAIGNADEMRNYAQLMESLEDVISSVYAIKTGLTKEEAKAKYINNGDRWLTASEALSEKLIDGVYDAPANQAKAPSNLVNEKDLVGFFNAQMNYKFQKINNMLKLTLTPEQMAKLSIANNADEAAMQSAIDKLISEADKVPTLTADLSAANAAKKTAEDALSNLKAATTKTEVDAILTNAMAAKKITVEGKNQLAIDYATNPVGLKKLVDAMPAITGVVNKINEEDKTIEKLLSMSWDELDKSGKAEELKAKNLDAFKAKFKEKFGSDYNG